MFKKLSDPAVLYISTHSTHSIHSTQQFWKVSPHDAAVSNLLKRVDRPEFSRGRIM